MRNISNKTIPELFSEWNYRHTEVLFLWAIKQKVGVRLKLSC